MTSYLFIFGRSPQLALQELTAISGALPPPLTPEVACIEDLSNAVDPQSWIQVLGGTVKIARKLSESTELTPATLTPYLEHTAEDSIVFGVSVYGAEGLVTSKFLREMKELLALKHIRSRFVSAHEGDTLTSVVIAKQHVYELIVVYAQGRYIIGQTQQVQDFEQWNRRDYGRPYADPRSGMLPPKVARMAVNLAGESKVKRQMSKVLLDPFCGMGTILGEALLAGWTCIGSDQSEEVVNKAKKNLEWLTGLNPVMSQDSTLKQFQLLRCDATHISDMIPESTVDAIVTEPFMGSNDQQEPMTIEHAKNRMKGLEKLYIGCLKDWRTVLKPGGTVVIALPEYRVNDRSFFVKNVIDRCETLGYTVSAGPLPYSRPQAIVRRKFFVLQKISMSA